MLSKIYARGYWHLDLPFTLRLLMQLGIKKPYWFFHEIAEVMALAVLWRGTPIYLERKTLDGK